MNTSAIENVNAPKTVVSVLTSVVAGTAPANSSPKQMEVFPPGEARTLVEGRLMFMSVLINVDIFHVLFINEFYCKPLTE